MTPFHFGNGRRRLFGIYEPALCKSVKERAVLLCHPEGNEQVFAYRTMRQLAARLAGAGFHVLRFDYFGTGDSYGETGEGNIASWCEDIDTAMNELRDITAAAQVSLVGLRLGANLAARAAAKRPGETGSLFCGTPSRLVRWPVTSLDRMEPFKLKRLGQPASPRTPHSPEIRS